MEARNCSNKCPDETGKIEPPITIKGTHSYATVHMDG